MRVGGGAQRPDGHAVLQRPARPLPQHGAARNLPLGPEPAKLGPQLLGRLNDQRPELVDGRDLGPAGAVAGGQQHPQRLRLATTPRRDQVVTGQRLPRCPEGVQGVALGPGPARRPFGPPDLHHLLAAGLQKAGQPSAVAASTLHRPTSPSRHLRLAELQQALVAPEIGGRHSLRQGAPDPVGGCGGQGVPVGVHPDHPVDGVGQPGHCARAPFQQTPGRGGLEPPRGASVTGHNPQGLDRLLIRPASGVPGRRRHHGRHLVTKATQVRRLNRCESCRGARRRSLTRSPRPLGETHRTVGRQEANRRGGRNVTATRASRQGRVADGS
jgi:hypothetical protein